MIPEQTLRSVTSSGVIASAPFGISAQDTAHLMEILRNMYSDRILAVLREYSANAWDAHNEFGKGQVPILVTMPMDEDPNLRIRDYGPGMSIDEVLTVYNQYGRSSKRGTNLAVGQLGIGSKSAFCYADSFTVTSWHGGFKRIFIAVVDASNIGDVKLVHEEELLGPVLDWNETGVEIQLAIKREDITRFHDRARGLFRHFLPRPTINIDLPPPLQARAILKNGTIRPANEGSGWTALMGCVPYRVTIGQIDTQEIGDHVHKIAGELYFNIGEVDMAPSREELKYTDRTREALVQKINDLVDEFIQHTMGTIESSVFSDWEKRLRAQILNQLELPIPKQWKDITDSSVKIEYNGNDFILVHNKATSTRISVASDTRLLLDDTGKELVGYNLRFSDWVVRIPEGSTLEQMRPKLDAALLKAGVLGVTIVNLSTLPWVAPYRKPPKQTNPKHKVSTFKLALKGTYKSPYSDCWTIEKRVPDKNDLFVIVRNFRPFGYKNFFEEYTQDRMLASQFGGIMPEVYGYKSTERKPVDPSTIIGIPYQSWREGFVKSLITKEITDLIVDYHWSRVSQGSSWSSPTRNHLHEMSKVLGADHPIVEFFTKCLVGEERMAKFLSVTKREAIAHLATRAGFKFSASAASSESEHISKGYPLLQATNISNLWDYRHAKAWLEYVQIVDQLDTYKKKVYAGHGVALQHGATP